MGRYNQLLLRADNLRTRTDKALKPINEMLQKLLGDEGVVLVFEPGDGWVVSWGHNSNSVVTDLDELLSLRREDAIEYLKQRSV